MNFQYVTLFIVILQFCSNYAAPSPAYLEPKTVLTQIGASYVIMLKHNTVAPVECLIDNGKHNFSINLIQEGIAPELVNSNFNRRSGDLINPRADTDIISSLGHGICGFKMDSVSKDTTKKWKISFLDQSITGFSGEARVVIRPVFPRHEIVYANVGAQFFINCLNSEAGDLEYDILYCKLFNPQNEMIKLDKKSCRHVVETSKLTDFGTWRCEQTFESNMVPTIVTKAFIPIQHDVVETWTNTTDNYVNIGCRVINATSKFKFCVMTIPDGYEIAMQPGLATKRYTAIGTNSTNSICLLQIKRPLEETEKGLWRCEQRNEPYSPIGGYVAVSSESSSYKTAPKVPKNVFVHVNETLKLTCIVPYSSPYCYMRGPDGFMYPLNDDRLNSLGICEFSKEKAQETDNGTWICGFGKKTGEPDDVYSFEVYVPETIPIQPQVQEIESRLAGVARLICTTRGLGDYPLKYCRFLSPDGKMYQIENHQTSDRISYEGRGLEYGDCGILLQDVSESDQGTWSCITRIQRVNIIGSYEDTDEVYTNIHLEIKERLSIASSLGIAFGVIAIFVVTAVIAIYRYQKRRGFLTNIRSLINRRNSHNSDTSGQHEIAFDIREGVRSYDATNIRVRNVNNPEEGNERISVMAVGSNNTN